MIRIGPRHILRIGLKITIQIMMLIITKRILRFGQKIMKSIGPRHGMVQLIQRYGMLSIQKYGLENTVKIML